MSPSSSLSSAETGKDSSLPSVHSAQTGPGRAPLLLSQEVEDDCFLSLPPRDEETNDFLSLLSRERRSLFLLGDTERTRAGERLAVQKNREKLECIQLEQRPEEKTEGKKDEKKKKEEQTTVEERKRGGVKTAGGRREEN